MPTLAEQIALSILAKADVEDCFVLEMKSRSSPVLLAYVVETSNHSTDGLDAALRAEAPDRRTSDEYIPVATLPLTSFGEVDVEALQALGLVNSELLESAEQRITRLAGRGRAAFVIETDPVPLPPIHLSDLFPDWTRASSIRNEPDSKPAMNPVDVTLTDKPAICVGAALRTPIPINLGAALRRTVAEFGSSEIIYIQDDEREIVQSYAGLLEDAERILRSLRSLGAQPQDRFIFQFRRNQDYIPAFWACQLGGFVPVPISIAPTYEQPNATISKLHNAWLMLDKPIVLTSEDLRSSILGLKILLDFADLRVIVIEDLRKAERDSEWHSSKPEDLALMLFTSGSTGKPKAVRQTHRALLSRSAATAQETNLSSADVFLNWMPLDHVGGIVMYHMPGIYLGARQIHVPTPVIVQTPLKWLDLIERYGVTTTWAPNFAFGLVNTQAEEIAKRTWDLSTLVFILNGGESIVARTARHFMELLIPHRLPPTAMRPSWGMSETCSGVTYSDRFTLDRTSDNDMFVQVGAPAPEFAFRIVDASDLVMQEGRIGRLQVKGPSVTLGYDRNPTANEESFTEDGWFITGDLGKVDDGQLTITGRQKEVIIVNGVNFYPHELEALVEEVSGVATSFSAVCAVREEGSDTDSIAVFFHPLSHSDNQTAAVIREIRGRMVRNAGVNPVYMVPLEKRQIPKTEIGKIQRTQLQQRLAAGEFNDVLKRVDVLTESANTIPNWFFEKVWQRRNLVAKQRQEAPVCSLVFLDKTGLGLEVCSRLRLSGGVVIQVEARNGFSSVDENNFTIDPSNSEHYRQLLTAVTSKHRIDSVLHFLTYGLDENARSSPELRVLSVLRLTQALAQATGKQGVDLALISSDAQFVSARDSESFVNAALPAIVRTLTAEEPQLRCRHIDLNTADRHASAEVVLQELGTAGRDAEVAYRGDFRYVPRLRRSESRAIREGKDQFVKGGTYLLTGGLGGIGVEIARLLLTRYDAHLVLIGRSDVMDAASPAAVALQSLNTFGDVRYISVDVGDSVALEKSVSTAEQQWGRPLDGILHMAATYHDGEMDRETAETLADAFHAKVNGTWALQRLLESRRNAFFIGFSSVLSYFPGALVGAYAAANRTLENITQCLHARGFRAYSVAWSGWRETGMSRGRGAREALRAKGIREMSVEQGWNSLLVALRGDLPLLFVGLDPANTAIRKVTVGESCALRRLSAFYLSTDKDALSSLRQLELHDRFGHTVPFLSTAMNEIPLTASGLVDRELLVASIRRAGAAPYVEPKTETERQICAVWQDVLKAPHLGAEDNFFISGGHSLLATRVMSRLCSIFSVDIPLRSLFDSPTVAGLALKVEQLRHQRIARNMTIQRVEDRDQLPLSFTQQRLWFLEQWQPGGHVYNVPLLFRVHGPLDIGAFQLSLNAVVLRHESLRTTFHMHVGQPIQRTTDDSSVPVLVIDVRGHQGDVESHAIAIAGKEMCRPFDLSSDVLLRAVVLQLANDEWLLGIALHHIAADGWSLDILFRELSDSYEAFERGDEWKPDPLTIQFADYASWQREYLAGPILAEQLAYWRQNLEGAPPQLKLRSDMPRPATQTFQGAVLAFKFPGELAQTVIEICRIEEVTPFIALLAVMQILLRQYSGQNDISVGSPIANRTNLETEGLIGFFANTLVLRTIFPRDPSFKEILAIARESALGAYAHQHMPFERLVEILRPQRAGYNPLFQVNFRVLTSPPGALRFGQTIAERSHFDPGTARFDLALELLATSDRLEGFFEYSTDLFYPETIRSLQKDFEQTLRLVSKRPTAPLSALGLDSLPGLMSERRPTAIRRRAAKAPGVVA